ncbi:VOC family protein [Clostridium oryzae]|uniref:Glyoxalase-like domain protein n=1 Tax=Clostridium oryzae TaxID=1450648 RepID=A0A1V4I433_9CLOT|nr:VOC family protein [Clostridium oryzae]OPJ54634.1 glyoxalase-like domain protein [Clostridium oryzae]
MLHLGSVYLIARDMGKAIDFYEKLLEMKVSVKRYDRWAQFDFEGKCLALFNETFDEKLISKNKELEKHYNKAYIKYYCENMIKHGNSTVLNFWVEDLRKEYERLKLLNIGKLSEIMYINISSPYYMFVVSDPDGNTIEITGRYTE